MQTGHGRAPLRGDRLLQLLPRLLHRGARLRRLLAGRLGGGLQALQQLGRARGGCAPAPCRKRRRVGLRRVLIPCGASARCAGSIPAALAVRCSRSPTPGVVGHQLSARCARAGAAHLIDSEASRVWLRADRNSAVSACSCLRTASRASSCASAASCTTALPPAPHRSQRAAPHAARTVTRHAPPAGAPRTPARAHSRQGLPHTCIGHPYPPHTCIG